MKKNQRIIAGIAAIVVGVGIIVAAVLVGNNQKPEDNTANNVPEKICPMSENEGVTTINYSGVADETALATLKGLCETTTQTSEYGEFVSGINGKDAGTEYFWAFYVNDVMAEVGAGSYKAKDGDKIKWELTKTDNNY